MTDRDRGADLPPRLESGAAARAAARLALTLYRTTGHLVAPLVRQLLARRLKRGHEDPARLDERLGRTNWTRPAGPLIWLHGASVGEAVSALPLIARIREAHPDLRLLMTTGTVTSARLMAGRLPDGVIHQYAPVDLPAAVDRFLDHWRPECALILESELWPNLLEAAGRRGLDLVLVNARMSQRSFRSWRRFPALAQALLARFSLVLAQSDADAARFAALGAPAPLVAGNLKAAAPPLPAEPAALKRLRDAIGGRPCWLAASTHPGEEDVVVAAHRSLSRDRPDLLTIIAPRHPERGAELAERLTAQGLKVARRSAGQAPGPTTQLYLADTIGELGLWYRLADIVFIGGSLVPRGGQNLLEPAQLGCAILTGPDTSNFADAAANLETAGALNRVGDAEALAAAVARLLETPEERHAMTEAARSCARRGRDCLENIYAALRPHLIASEGRTRAMP